MKKFYSFGVVLCVLTGLSGFAFADTIEMGYVAVDAGGQENLTLGNTNYSGANGVQAMHTQNPDGSLASLIAPNAWAYCYELGAYTDFPFNTYNVSTLASVMDSGKAALISQLWAQHYNHAWESSTYVYYNYWVGGQPADTLENQQALAMNFAIYEINYDFTGTLASLDIANGSFKVNSAIPTAAMNIATEWLNNLVLPGSYTGQLAQLLALTSNSKQDLIVEVPEPLTLSLLGLGGLGLLRRKVR